MGRERIAHTIKENKTTTLPKRIIYYDIETTQQKISDTETEQKFWFGCATFVNYERKFTEDSIVFHSQEEFWKWVVSKTSLNKSLYVLSHNQDFDFREATGFTILQKFGFYIHKQIFEYPRCIVTWGTQPKVNGEVIKRDANNQPYPRRYIKLLDTLNWFRESLSQLGETIGIPKLPFPDYSEPFDVWIKYCQQDVYVMRRAFETYLDFLRTNDMGNFGLTIAAQSLNCFKHKYMKHKIRVHTEPDIINLERRSYFGGRTECFHIGNVKNKVLYKVDINSMYPYVMRNFDYPINYYNQRSCFPSSSLKTYRKKHLLIYDVTVTTNTPCIPYCYKKEGIEDKDIHIKNSDLPPKELAGRLCFPVGTFRTVLCEPEYQLVEKYNFKHTIHKIALYNKAPVFKEYVTGLYKLRKHFRKLNNEQYQYFCKIFMNSLYGKFGQRNPEWQEEGFSGINESYARRIYNPNTLEYEDIKSIAGHLFTKIGWKEGDDTFVAIASFVTSYARRLIWQYIELAGYENCYYTDTDSLILNFEGLWNLKEKLSDTELGFMKVEGLSRYTTINNVKDYIFDNHITLKGVPNNAEKLSENKYLVEQWEHLNGAVMRDRAERVIVKQVIKELEREYKKGVPHENTRVHPYELYYA